MCNPHSTTSPKGSPNNISLTNSSQLTPTHTDDNDNNNNNVDEGFENDNISVTGSPPLANSTEDDDRRSPTPPIPGAGGDGGSGGAFTSLIQRNSSQFKKADLLTGFSSHIHPQPNHQHALNHALAAQLFLQSPLMPQPSQWLYSQLYNNYNDLPWFRNTLQSNNNGSFRLPTAGNNSNNNIDDSGAIGGQRDLTNLTLAKRSVTLISHNDDDVENCLSPPVSSTKRTPSPTDDIEIVSNRKSSSEHHLGAIKGSRSVKNADVWRPY